MKIKDFAEEKGLTKQAIYKGISRAGLSAKQITDRNGNITSKGFHTLRSLFPDPDTDPEPDKSSGNDQQAEEQETEVQRLRKQIEELENRCKEWEKRYFDALENAKQEGQQLRILLSQEQQLRLNAEKQGFFRRLFAGKKAEQE